MFIIYVVAYNFIKLIYKLGSIKTTTNLAKRFDIELIKSYDLKRTTYYVYLKHISDMKIIITSSLEVFR